MGKALVIGKWYYTLSHEVQVRCAFLNRAPSDWTCDIAIVSNRTTFYNPPAFLVKWAKSRKELYEYACTSGYDIIIDAHVEVWGRKAIIDEALDKGVWPVQAHCSDNPTSNCLSPPRLFAGIVCSGGTETHGNAEAYGRGLEIFTQGCIYRAGHPIIKTEQSFGTPGIAALLAQAKNAKMSFWDARALIRATPNNNNWTDKEGFGYADLPQSLTVSDVDQLPLYGPVDVSITGQGSDMVIRWRNFKSSRWAATVIKHGDKIVYEGQDTIARYSCDENDIELTFQSKDKAGLLSTIHDCDRWPCEKNEKEGTIDFDAVLSEEGEVVPGVLRIKIENTLDAGNELLEGIRKYKSDWKIIPDRENEWEAIQNWYLDVRKMTRNQIELFTALQPSSETRGYAISYMSFQNELGEDDVDDADFYETEETVSRMTGNECRKPRV